MYEHQVVPSNITRHRKPSLHPKLPCTHAASLPSGQLYTWAAGPRRPSPTPCPAERTAVERHDVLRQRLVQQLVRAVKQDKGQVKA